MPFLTAAGHRLEYEWVGPGTAEPAPGRPVLVFLHEGLGSIRQWRDFPAKLAEATGCRGVVYSRYGYGQSDVLEAPREVTFMHDEARIALPAFLQELGIREPVLVGHSDGASISLIHAGSGHPVRGVVVEAPHVFIEEFNLASIVEARKAFDSTDLRERLGKYHRDPEKTFRGWSEAWLSPAFREWNIESFLPGIRCPVMAIQGFDDQYGSMEQLDRIARQVGGPCELVKLEQCGHAPHKDQAGAVLNAMQRFIESVLNKEPA